MALYRPFDEPLVRATFLHRPNRFLVRCLLPSGDKTSAFLPNPGRLHELLLPGAAIVLTRRRPAGECRKTDLTCVAVEREGVPVFLHTHVTNRVARHLVEAGKVPGFRRARIVRSEVPVGRSRFDLLLSHRGREVFTEVKSVTLFGNDVAMFPDAVTDRGRRHLLELQALSRSGLGTVVLFLVHYPGVTRFMPDYHTDLKFSRTLIEVRRDVRVVPLALSWTPGLELSDDVRLLAVPWRRLAVEARDRGAYLLVLRLARPSSVHVGRLGRLTFEQGYYVYVGSAMAHLSRRIERHRKQIKTFHWHIDYLRAACDYVTVLPIRSSRRLECSVAAALGTIMRPAAGGFGSSDCGCGTHLFSASRNPLHERSFHDMLHRLRIQEVGP